MSGTGSSAAEWLSETQFMNVDLDLEGRIADIDAVASELDRCLLQLQSGDSDNGKRTVRYESLEEVSDADVAIGVLVDAIESLSTLARSAWGRAISRDFNVGVQAGHVPHAAEFAIEEATLARVAAVGGRLVLTVYAPLSSSAEVSREG